MVTDPLIFSHHAVERMLQRGISSDDVYFVVSRGTVVPGGSPHPRKLMLAFPSDRPVHVVIDDLSVDDKVLVITVYEPDPGQWDESFTRRKDGSDEMRDLQSGENPSGHDDHDT